MTARLVGGFSLVIGQEGLVGRWALHSKTRKATWEDLDIPTSNQGSCLWVFGKTAGGHPLGAFFRFPRAKGKEHLGYHS